jgi:hypothetical protein
MAAFPKYTYKHLTTGTTKIKDSVGTLAAVVVNKALTGTVTVSDGSNTIAVLTNGTTAPLGTVLFGGAGGVQFASLTVALSATEDITVCYE